MSEKRLEVVAERLLSSDVVTAVDVLALRRASYNDGAISAAEAEVLMQIEARCPRKCTEWNLYYIEAIVDFVVHQAQPAGYVTAENADWLIENIMADGQIHSATELELVVKVVEVAKYCPKSLVSFTLSAVKDAVVSGSGPLRDGSELMPNRIGISEVELLQRVLYGADCHGNGAISAEEAGLLFDINDAVSLSANVPAWSELFVKAVANHLMALSGYSVPPREEALRIEQWLNEPADMSMATLFSKSMGNLLKGVMGKYDKQTPEDRAVDRLAAQYRELVTNEKVAEVEADWVVRRIKRDGKLHPNERALLEFLKVESPDVCPSLHALLDQAA